MRSILVLLFLSLYGFNLIGQEKQIEKPEYVIIANNKIITKEKLQEYVEQGYVKAMNNGVSEKEKNRLAKKFGNKIGDKEFIIKVDLITEKEKRENQKKIVSNTNNLKKEIDDSFILHTNDFAKDFTVQMVNGETIRLSDLKGKVILLNFWATWCAPCLLEFYEIPHKILKPYETSDFVFLPISRGESMDKVIKKMNQLKEKGIHFNVGIDPNKEIWNEYATNYIPKNFLIDKNGVIKYTSTGNSKGNLDKIALEIKKLLAE